MLLPNSAPMCRLLCASALATIPFLPTATAQYFWVDVAGWQVEDGAIFDLEPAPGLVTFDITGAGVHAWGSVGYSSVPGSSQWLWSEGLNLEATSGPVSGEVYAVWLWQSVGPGTTDFMLVNGAYFPVGSGTFSDAACTGTFDGLTHGGESVFDPAPMIGGTPPAGFEFAQSWPGAMWGSDLEFDLLYEFGAVHDGASVDFSIGRTPEPATVLLLGVLLLGCCPRAS